jgi:hypothetical protein
MIAPMTPRMSEMKEKMELAKGLQMSQVEEQGKGKIKPAQESQQRMAVKWQMNQMKLMMKWQMNQMRCPCQQTREQGKPAMGQLTEQKAAMKYQTRERTMVVK